MKRIFTLTVLAGLAAVQSSAALGQGGPPGDPNAAAPPPPAAAPQTAPQPGPPQAAAPAAPAAPQQPAESLGLSPGIFGNQMPSAGVVQPGQPRGQLGGLASGAPGVAASLPQLSNGAAAAPAPAGGAAVTTQTTVVNAGAVSTVAVTPIQRRWMVSRLIQHCVFRSLYDAQMSGQPRMIPLGGFGPVGPFVPPPFGDLELVGVGMVADGGADRGPTYRVTIRNHSPLPVHHFRVSLIAVLGTLDAGSPVATGHIDVLGPNATGQLDIALPATVLGLGPQGHAAPFDTLVAVIDSFDELIETNELNNVATLSRVEIALIETTVTAPAPAAAQAALAPAAAAPALGAAPAGPPATAAPAPAEQVPAPAPPDRTELDQLDLDKVDGASALFSR